MIIVTGATGLLGSHVLVELLKRGKKVRALHRKSSDLSSIKKVFNHFFGEQANEEFDKIEWVEGDILDIYSLEQAINGCEIVYHCAALVSFIKRDFKRLMKTNKEGTANVVNVSLHAGVKQFCHVSSTAAIGKNSKKELFDENDKWISSKENTNYSTSKYSAENEVWRGKEEGMDVIIINPSMILGVGNWNESSLSIFKVVKKGLKFYTPGANAFVDARDVAYILCELSERNIVNERFLIVSENIAFKTLFDRIAKEFDVKAPSIKVKKWMASIAWRLEGILGFFGRKQNITKETARSSMETTKFSNEKISKVLDYSFIPVDQSIEDAVLFFKKNSF